MDGQRLIILVSLYSGLLFAIAWMAERYGHAIQKSWWRPLIYSLSIGVYCSSWTFLGAVGQAVETGWNFLPIYLGPILLFAFGWTFIRRLLIISARNKVTSIADFIGSRYGKSQPLAAFVTIVLVIGTLPYIALQLRAVDIAWSTITWTSISSGMSYGSSLIAALIMAWFAIVFGTRVIEGANRYRGLITAVAAESLIKLIAFAVVAWLAWELWPAVDSITDVHLLPNFQWEQFFSPIFFTELILAATAIVCLPRQFHVMVVEYQHKRDIAYTRWLLPVYLALFALFAIPLAHAGSIFLSGLNVSPDSYVLTLPKAMGEDEILAISFIGAISAATGMVVVATIALSVMISNELVVPIWLRSNSKAHPGATDLGRSLRLIRRVSIITLLALGWGLERMMSQNKGLASMGLISFAACAQLLPSVIAALYWQRAHAKGVMAGLSTGICLWFYCLLLPVLLPDDHSLMTQGLLGFSFLKPHDLFFMGWLDPLSHGVFWSLILNFQVFFLVSKKATFTNLDLRQAESFTQLRRSASTQQMDRGPSGIEMRQIQALIEPLLGQEKSKQMWHEFERQSGHRLLPHDQAPRFTITAIERDIGAIIGAVSARKAMEFLATQRPLLLQDFVSLVSDSSRQIQFSQSLLQTTLETIPQGISVVDETLKLVAWNQQYQKLFDYPKRLLYVGCDIKDIYHYNAVRGYLGEDNSPADELVARRLQQLRSGIPYRLQRKLPNGTVLEIRGMPLKNGGYVTTFNDISDYHAILDELEVAKHTLEDSVEARTAELREAIQSLERENELRAKTEKELHAVYASKNRFLAAVSHDLLQPINASRLFVSSLENQIKPLQNKKILSDISQLDDALTQAEQLISSLREISRLGSGKERPKRKPFSVDSLFRPLASEATILAKNKGIDFRWVNSSQWIYSDAHLLRRVLQNFISNALRYTTTGKVLLGCRWKSDGMSLEVWDTGPGISSENQKKIFEEFERIPSGNTQGLGLGLSIAQRIAHLLGHPITLHSEVGKGSVFKISVPFGKPQNVSITQSIYDPNLKDIKILCIDNEPHILAGMQSLLEQWGCYVVTATSLSQALAHWRDQAPPQLLLVDFHLDNEIGIDILEALRLHWQTPLPAIVISANNSEEVINRVTNANCLYLSKPVKPHALRNTIHKALRKAQIKF